MSSTQAPSRERIAVVGAGVTGLTAAFELSRAGVEVVVLEASDRPGGKVDAVEIAGLRVDSGPDGFLARDTAAAELCHRLGLGPELVTPASSEAYVWVDRGLRPLPRPSVLGAPVDASTLAGTGIVSAAGLDGLRRGLQWDAPALAGDATVGEVLRPRVGDEVFEHLVDPLLGGINAGSADRMSIEASAAPLYEAARKGGPFGAALSRLVNQRSNGGASTASAPVFQGVRGGTARIIDALSAELGKAVHLSTPVEALIPRTRGPGTRPEWKVATAMGSFVADGVILAAPAWETARLLEAHAPEAAAVLGGIEYADVVLAIFVAGPEQARLPLDGSGFLVPRGQGLLMTACSWSSSKWAHYHRPGGCVVRVSAGRTDDRRWLDLEPAELAAVLSSELVETGVLLDPGAHRDNRGVHTRIVPWRRSLPQYRPGHLDRVAAAEGCLAAEVPGVVATGAAFRGLGLPACVRQAQTAASVLTGAVLC